MKAQIRQHLVQQEYVTYLDEFESVVHANVAHFRGVVATESSYASLFPFWVLLRNLIESPFYRDITRERVLHNLRAKGNLDTFIRANKSFRISRDFDNDVKEASLSQTFTEYFAELFSDSLILSNSLLMANYRGGAIAVRCMLEDLYRHLYYKDHPEEFWCVFVSGLKEESRLGLQPKDFREYLGRASYLRVFHDRRIDLQTTASPNDNLFSENSKVYDEASAFVHGSKHYVLGGLRSNADLTRDTSQEEALMRLAIKAIRVAILFLIAAHRDTFLSFEDFDKSAVMTAFSSDERGRLRELLVV